MASSKNNTRMSEELLEACKEGREDIVRRLIERGVNVNAVNEDDWTALHRASFYGHVNIVNILLAAGANVNAVTKAGRTALHCASYRGHVDIVTVLLAAGVNIHAVNKDGKTALDMARSWGRQDIVNVLLAHLDKVNAQSQKKVIAQQTAGATATVSAGATAAVSAGATAVVAAGATAAVTAGETAGATAAVTGAKLKSVKVSNKQRVASVKPPVERDDGMGVLTQEMAQLNRGQIPEADLMTLRKFHVRMKSDLRPFPLIDHLYEKEIIDEKKGVIDDHDLQVLVKYEENKGCAASIGKMLEILKRCGNHAFELFLECLEQEDVGYAILASELRKHRYGGAQP